MSGKLNIMTDVVKEKASSQEIIALTPPLEGSDDDEEGDMKIKVCKSRRELPSGAVATLKAWLLSPEHFTHPYPTPQDQEYLMHKTGIDKKQLKNWFTNARRRIWKPMLKKQLEQGKIPHTGPRSTSMMLAATSAPGLISTTPSVPDYHHLPIPKLNTDKNNPGIQLIHQHYPQSSQHPHNSNHNNSFATSLGAADIFAPQQSSPQTVIPGVQISGQNNNFFTLYQQPPYNQHHEISETSNKRISTTAMKTLSGLSGAHPHGSVCNINKTDSHTILMELFARDQDLIRKNTEESSKRTVSTAFDQMPVTGHVSELVQHKKINNSSSYATQHQYHQVTSQHSPIDSKMTSGASFNKLNSFLNLNSFPHFSSANSLNNLAVNGVKNITSMSSADLVSIGSLNKNGNLAQVKSLESMGRTDSYAFLEFFFDNPTNSVTNESQRGQKRERDDDDNVGLSLDSDDASPCLNSCQLSTEGISNKSSNLSTFTPIPTYPEDTEGLKRAYDDALAARGLISVSRSSENLTDLVLPSKMQRTLSQEILKNINSGGSTNFTGYNFSTNAPHLNTTIPIAEMLTPDVWNYFHINNQYPDVPPSISKNNNSSTTNHNFVSAFVEVPGTTKCSLCSCINVDTQLRPCGHMFHGRCLKPSLTKGEEMGPPQCPIDHITMQSAVLAIPTDESLSKSSPLANDFSKHRSRIV